MAAGDNGMASRPPDQAGAAGHASAAPADWVVLAAPSDARGADEPPSLGRVIVPVAIAALVVAAIVAVAGSLVSQRIAEQQAVHDVTELTDDLAVSVIQPALTDTMPGDPAQARRILDPLVGHWLNRVGEMVRVKVWTPTGTVLYSDEPRLIGRTFELEPGSRLTLLQPRTEADITDLRRPENRYERGEGKLLEVYRPVWTPGGQPLLFETYFRYDTVSQRSHQLWRGFVGVMLSSLLALLLLLGAAGWLMLVRARRARVRQEDLMRRALDASDAERRRIAATLHDGVVQQLVAASFIAAGQAQRAAADGDQRLAGDLRSVAASVRDGVAGLRSLLVDIYPPSLRAAGLANALRDLAGGASGHGGAVEADIDADVADRVPEQGQEAIFRIAQEALRNAVRHAHAEHITLRLAAAGDGTARLEIEDDGLGFDAIAVAGEGRSQENAVDPPEPGHGAGPEGHFGLRLMADAARHGGGWLGVISSPGMGTRIRYQLSAP
jgi:two-component system NarL family sensor kinase